MAKGGKRRNAWLKNPRKKKMVDAHTRVSKDGDLQIVDPHQHEYPTKLKPTDKKKDAKKKKEDATDPKNRKDGEDAKKKKDGEDIDGKKKKDGEDIDGKKKKDGEDENDDTKNKDKDKLKPNKNKDKVEEAKDNMACKMGV